MTDETPAFSGLYLVVADMAATVAFYRLLGLTFDDEDAASSVHVVARLADGVKIAFGTLDLTKSYNPAWPARGAVATNALQFDVADRQAVDDVYERLTSAGYAGPLAPFDAFWGSRYAEVADPDGNVLGFHSPRDPSKAGRPPM